MRSGTATRPTKPGRALVVVAIALLALIGSAAYAAYISPTLEITAQGNETRIVARANVVEDATAKASIVIAAGTSINTAIAPGTVVGTATADVSALALGGALLKLTGDIVVAAPGAIPPEAQAGCVGTTAPALTFVLALTAAGQTITLPAYLVPTSGPRVQLGAAELVFCLPPPDLPVEQGGATFGAKFLGADLRFTNVFTAPSESAWIAYWIPYIPGTNQPNPAGMVASLYETAPLDVSLSARRVGGKIELRGRVLVLGTGIRYPIRIFGAVGNKPLTFMRSVVATGSGTFSVRLAKSAKQTRFQARAEGDSAIIAGQPARDLCAQAFPAGTLEAPCSSVGFSFTAARSKITKVR